ncbi:hypothetical protein ACQCVP_20200 [Rossellomorea vietnamensis]
MKFQVDKQKALDLAKEMGLNISFDIKNPGVIINSKGSKQQKQFKDFFPELNGEYNHEKFVTKDSGDLPSVSSSINITTSSKKVQKITIESIEKGFATDSHGKWSRAS